MNTGLPPAGSCYVAWYESDGRLVVFCNTGIKAELWEDYKEFITSCVKGIASTEGIKVDSTRMYNGKHRWIAVSDIIVDQASTIGQ